jgi:uncharacterized membrane protein
LDGLAVRTLCGEPKRFLAASGVLVTLRGDDDNSLPPARPERVTFTQDFKQFFLRGLAALLPTLITLSLLVWMWSFLWEYLGKHLIYALKWVWLSWADSDKPAAYIGHFWSDDLFRTRLVGVLLAVLLVYIVGFFVGNLIGRTFWKLGETLVMRIPIVRAIYPAVKQVTDFLLADRKKQFQASRVVAIQPHEKGIWSVGLVTGQGLKPMNDVTGQEMIMVFLPNSPAAFSGYVMVVPRSEIVELPLTVEEAMRFFVSGGVIVPGNEIVVGGKVLAIGSKTEPAAQRQTG